MHVIHAAHSSVSLSALGPFLHPPLLYLSSLALLSFSLSPLLCSLVLRTPASYVSADVQFISYVTSSTRSYIHARRGVRKLEYRPFTCRQPDKPRPALKRLNAPIVAFSSETGTRCTAKRISQVHFAEEALVRNRR